MLTAWWAQVTKHIRVRAGGSGAEGAQDLSTFTPTFLWLLRDFYLGKIRAFLVSLRPCNILCFAYRVVRLSRRLTLWACLDAALEDDGRAVRSERSGHACISGHCS